jgi:hypothetical protein
MNVERVLFEGISFSPHAIEHLLSRKDTAWRFEKMPKDLKLFRRQFDQFAVHPHLMSIKIHQHAACHAGSSRSSRQFLSAQDGAYTGHKRSGRLIAERQVSPPTEVVDTLVFGAGGVVPQGDDRGDIEGFMETERVNAANLSVGYYQ